MVKEQWDEKQENLLAKSPGEVSNQRIHCVLSELQAEKTKKEEKINVWRINCTLCIQLAGTVFDIKHTNSDSGSVDLPQVDGCSSIFLPLFF